MIAAPRPNSPPTVAASGVAVFVVANMKSAVSTPSRPTAPPRPPLEAARGEEDPRADQQAQQDADCCAEPDSTRLVAVAGPGEIGQDDADDERRLEAFAQGDQQRGSHLGHVTPLGPVRVGRPADAGAARDWISAPGLGYPNS